MPPLLPEYLSRPVQVVVQSTPVDWWSIGGTVAGAALGAGIGGLVAYIGTLRANRSIVNQGKLEECLTLVNEMQTVYIMKLRYLGFLPPSLGLAEAKAAVGRMDSEAMVHLAERIHTLAKLHAIPIRMKSERLVVMALHARSLIGQINDRLEVGSQESFDNSLIHSSELAKSAYELCKDIESYIVKNAKT